MYHQEIDVTSISLISGRLIKVFSRAVTVSVAMISPFPLCITNASVQRPDSSQDY
jgi:hypothetical protein